MIATIRIIKDTQPNHPQDFDFTTQGGLSPSTFSLDDDADGALPNTQTFDVGVGSYTVTETLVAGFTTEISCIDPDGGTTTSGSTANIDLDSGETVECTFINTLEVDVLGGDVNPGQGFQPGSKNNPFLVFGLNPRADTVNFNRLAVNITGSTNAADSFGLWESDDGSFDPESDTPLATAPGNGGGPRNFTGFNSTVNPPPPQAPAGAAAANQEMTPSYFVTVDVSPTASGADFIRGEITSSDDIGFESEVVVSGDFPIAGGDHALPVELSAFNGTVREDRVLLEWRTASETNNLGFHVYRGDAKDGDYARITPVLLKGHGTDSTPYDYRFADEDVVEGQSYWYFIEDVDFAGLTAQSDPIEVAFHPRDLLEETLRRKAAALPTEFALYQNFPNPFNPETWIPYDLKDEASVTITIYDTGGNSVRALSLGTRLAGSYTTKDRAAHWEGRSETGESVGSGIYFYFYFLRAGDFAATKKMIIVK